MSKAGKVVPAFGEFNNKLAAHQDTQAGRETAVQVLPQPCYQPAHVVGTVASMALTLSAHTLNGELGIYCVSVCWC